MLWFALSSCFMLIEVINCLASVSCTFWNLLKFYEAGLVLNIDFGGSITGEWHLLNGLELSR